MEFGCSFFQTGKTLGICQKILKYVFTQRIYLQHRHKFEVLKIKGCTRIVVGYIYNPVALKQILSWDNSIMEQNVCNRLYCIWNCGLRCILVVV